MNGEKWFAFIGPDDWFVDLETPIYHLVSETFARQYAQKHPDTIVFLREDA